MPEARIELEAAQTFLMGLERGSVDCIITDPPHDGLEHHRARGTTTRLVNAWFPVLPADSIVSILGLAWHALQKNAHCWVFADAQLEHALASRLTGGRLGVRDASLWTWWGSWIWVKLGRPGMGYHGRRRHERIMLLEKGVPKLRTRGQLDVIECAQVTQRSLGGRGGRKPYPTEKPVELLRKLLRASVAPGSTVLDPFCGSGATAEAALAEGCNFIGCDVQESAVAIARDRVKKWATREVECRS